MLILITYTNLRHNNAVQSLVYLRGGADCPPDESQEEKKGSEKRERKEEKGKREKNWKGKNKKEAKRKGENKNWTADCRKK